MIKDPIERTYLAGLDGYWADLVLEEFAFLEERGGRLDAVSFHQKGDYISYVGPWGAVTLEFAPDNHPEGRWIFSRARLAGQQSSFEGELDRLLRDRAPGMSPVPTAPMDRASIAASVEAWAQVLRSATDLI